MGILSANELVKHASLDKFVILGELSLDGRAKPVKGILSLATMARDQKMEGIILPRKNAADAAVVDGVKVYPVENLPEALEFLNGELEIEPTPSKHSQEEFQSFS